MARCGRCGADPSWIIGDPPKLSRDEEIDALRARVAELERERDEARRLVVGTAMFGSKCAYCGALVKVEDMNNFDGIALQLRRHAAKCPKHPSRAVEAECVELRAALRTAMEMVRLWHGMGMDTVSEQRAWKLYEEGAPEWQPLRDLRDRPPGSDAALRAMLLEAAHAERERWVSKMHGPADVVASALAQWDAEILASLLPPATQAQEGVAE